MRKPLRGEIRAERLRTKPTCNLFGAGSQPNAAKLARVIEYQRAQGADARRSEAEKQAVVLGWLVRAAFERQIATHAQVDEQLVVRELDAQELGAPADVTY